MPQGTDGDPEATARQLAREVTQPQRVGLTVSLVLFDEVLRHVERWCSGSVTDSPLIVERDDLSDAQRHELGAAVADMRAILSQTAEDLALEPETHAASRAIWAECLAIRPHIVEIGGRYLVRYGEVSPAVADYADELVSRLLEGLDRLVRAVAPD